MGKKAKLAILAATTVAIFGWNGTKVNTQLPPEQPETTSEVEYSSESQWRQPRLVTTLKKGHTTAVDALVFSPDGEILVSGGSYNDPKLVFWSITNGKKIENVRAQRTAVNTVVISPNGQSLVSAGDDAGINLWDWKTGKFQATFVEHDSNILQLAITPDSEILVSSALDGIKIWGLNPKRPIYTLTGLGNPSYAVAIHPDGQILASGDNQGKVTFWNLRTGTKMSEFMPHNESITGVLFTPDGKTLITGSKDRTIKIWDVATGLLLHTLQGHTGMIRAIAINPDGETLASASNDGARLWNVRNGRLVARLYGQTDWVQSLAFSQDGTMLATGSFDGTIVLWNKTELNN